MKDRSRTTQSHQVGLSFEIKEYFSLPCIPDDDDILGFWKSSRDKYRTLARLAATYLATPASSAPVERIFSIGGKIFTVFAMVIVGHKEGQKDNIYRVNYK